METIKRIIQSLGAQTYLCVLTAGIHRKQVSCLIRFARYTMTGIIEDDIQVALEGRSNALDIV